MYVSQQRLRKVIYIERTLFLPIRIIPKAMYPDILKTSIFWQPFLGPKQFRVVVFTPRASGTTC
jgi:hypothetical protein